MSNHTPEPWYNDSPYRVHGATSDPDKRNGHCIFDYKHNSDDPNPKDYDRIVDCVNALAGIEKPEEWVKSTRELPWIVVLSDGSGDVLARFRYHDQASEWVRRNYEGRCAVHKATDAAGVVG